MYGSKAGLKRIFKKAVQPAKVAGVACIFSSFLTDLMADTSLTKAWHLLRVDSER